MSVRFWFRPGRCAAFTSLRDMSLRRNKQPALRADGMSLLRIAMPFMCGLRA
jgi:hypothetical protein